MLHEYARTFGLGLTHPDHLPPPDVVAGVGQGVQRRYNVHRNNVTVSLIAALAAIYPAVQRITGVDFFRAMARFHVRATPPASPLLFEYGRGFPDFIASYEFAQAMPWLPDTARIERAWLDAYHAADEPVLSAHELAAVPGTALAGLRLRAHPAARIVRSRYPAVSIFTMNKADGPVSSLSSSEAQDALITRPGHEVVVSRLPAGGAVFLTALMAGSALADAATAAFDAAPGFDLPANLAAMLPAGVFMALQAESRA